MNSVRFKAILPVLLAELTASTHAPAQTLTNDDTVLKQIIIFGRHSVRSAVLSPAAYAQYSPRPYPDFGVPAGYLTAHGQQAAVLLGAYYRAYLISQGLLTGDATTDLSHSYFRANSIQRSNVTAMKLGEGLIPGITIPVHSYPLNQLDPVFEPIATNVAAIDTDRAAKEVKAMWGGGTALASAYSAEFSLIRSVLFNYQNGVQPPPAAPPGVTDPTAQPISLNALTSGVYSGNVVDMGGLSNTQSAAEPFVMEYADGKALRDVGWGQLSADNLSQDRNTIVEYRIHDAVHQPGPEFKRGSARAALDAASRARRDDSRSIWGSFIAGDCSHQFRRIRCRLGRTSRPALAVAGLPAGLLCTGRSAGF